MKKTKILSSLLLFSFLIFPSFSFAKDYTLQEAIDRALAENPKIDIAKTQVESSKYDVRSAYGAFAPTLSTTYSATRVDANSWTSSAAMQMFTQQALPDPMKIPVHATNFSWQVVASQPLFSGFLLLNQLDQAKLAKESQDLQYENANLQLVSNVQVAFIEFLRSEENIRSTERAMDRAKEQLNLTRAAYEVGLRPQLDVLQAELDLARTENTLIQVKNQREVFRSTLQALLALPTSSGEPDPNYVGSLHLIPFDRSLEKCVEDAMNNRPELKLGRLAVSMAETGKKMTNSAFYPQVRLNAAYNQNGDAYKNAGDSDSYSIGIGVTWNIFAGGQRYNESKKADLKISQTRLELVDAMNNVASGVKVLYMTSQEAKKRVGVTEQAVLKAQESYNAARARYELGVGTNLDLLLAQQSLSSEEANHTSALADYLLTLSKLYTAMGEFYIIKI